MTITTGSHHRHMIIAGVEVDAASGKRFDRESPAHGTVVASYPDADARDVDTAVQAARTAFDSGPWPRLAAADRAKALQRVADLIRRDAEDLATLEVLESGKPIGQARDEIEGTAGLWEYAASLGRHAYGDAHSGLGEDMLAMVLREPLGVTAMITPWNFPLLIVSQKLPFALAVGCTAVVKPSELTPGTTLRLAQLCSEAGIPAGVVNVISGAEVAGAALCAHPGVDMISFTGSTAVGRIVAATAGQHLKRVELELGGKNPQIVFPDANLEAAVDAIVFGIYFNQGECCNSGSRILVHRSIAQKLQDAVVERSRQVRVGDPLDESTKVGAIVSDEQLDTINRYVAEGTQQGAALVLGGAQMQTEVGRFYQPTVFADVSPDMSIAREEIFGPVLSLIPFDSTDEAIAIANSTTYGLSAGVWTQDVDTALAVARSVRAGTIWVNTWMNGYPELPFGGMRSSGIGRELGRQAIDAFTETKTIQLHMGPRTAWWLDHEAGR